MICFPYDDSFIFLLSLIGGAYQKLILLQTPIWQKTRRTLDKVEESYREIGNSFFMMSDYGTLYSRFIGIAHENTLLTGTSGKEGTCYLHTPFLSENFSLSIWLISSLSFPCFSICLISLYA